MSSISPKYYDLLLDFQTKSIDPLVEIVLSKPHTADTEDKLTAIIQNLPGWCSPALRRRICTLQS